MSPEQIIAYLEQQRTQSTSGLGQQFYASFADLYDRKLWNQLTKKIEEFIRNGNFSQGNELIRLYENFVIDFEQKINKLSLVHIALSAAKQFQDPQASIAFLQNIATKVQTHTEAFVLTVMETAAYQLSTGDLVSCKKAIEESEKLLDSLPGVEPVIHASFYRVYAAFDQARFNYVGFYKNSLLYLACVPLESIPLDQKIQRTYDLGIAALLGDSIYNFGDLLAHDIIKVLSGTNFEWIIKILKAFNQGDIASFEDSIHLIQQEALLLANLQFLHQKIRLMALIEIIFHLPADKRSLSLETIANGTKLPLDQVEHLLMKAMSLKLIKGVIDQVDGIVNVSWVQPRVLDKTQIAALKNRLEIWNQEIAKTINDIETETPELFA